MSDKEPEKPSKPPAVKVQTPVVKPTPMPGGTAAIMRVQDSVDGEKKKNQDWGFWGNFCVIEFVGAL